MYLFWSKSIIFQTMIILHFWLLCTESKDGKIHVLIALESCLKEHFYNLTEQNYLTWALIQAIPNNFNMDMGDPLHWFLSWKVTI